ncbi:MAG: GGDEF domain-containing protein [bacterium]
MVIISLGVCSYADGENMDGFIKRTDSAMYKAKSEGRNKVEILL